MQFKLHSKDAPLFNSLRIRKSLKWANIQNAPRICQKISCQTINSKYCCLWVKKIKWEMSNLFPQSYPHASFLECAFLFNFFSWFTSFIKHIKINRYTYIWGIHVRFSFYGDNEIKFDCIPYYLVDLLK